MNSTLYFPFADRLFIGLPFVASGLSKLAAYDKRIDLSSILALPCRWHSPELLRSNSAVGTASPHPFSGNIYRAFELGPKILAGIVSGTPPAVKARSGRRRRGLRFERPSITYDR
jgi:hypothetical protein